VTVIKAIIFDLGGVVLKGKTMDFIKQGEKLLGVKARQGTETCFDSKMNLGTSSLRGACERVFGKKMFDHEFIPVMKAWLSNWQMDEQLLEYAKRLGKRYRVAILSNSEQSYEEKYGDQLKKVFPVIIYSHRERVLKPERRAFELVLKKLGVAPEEAIMVDDCQENLDAAKAIGMHAVLYRTLDNLQKQLELHGARA
jgi:putative hydrolase of the HAD superfamily